MAPILAVIHTDSTAVALQELRGTEERGAKFHVITNEVKPAEAAPLLRQSKHLIIDALHFSRIFLHVPTNCVLEVLGSGGGQRPAHMSKPGCKCDQAHHGAKIGSQAGGSIGEGRRSHRVDPFRHFCAAGIGIIGQQDGKCPNLICLLQRFADPGAAAAGTDCNHQRAVGFADPDLLSGKKAGELNCAHGFHAKTIAVLFQHRRHCHGSCIRISAAGENDLSGIKNLSHGHKLFQSRSKAALKLRFRQLRKAENLASNGVIVVHLVHCFSLPVHLSIVIQEQQA